MTRSLQRGRRSCVPVSLPRHAQRPAGPSKSFRTGCTRRRARCRSIAAPPAPAATRLTYMPSISMPSAHPMSRRTGPREVTGAGQPLMSAPPCQAPDSRPRPGRPAACAGHRTASYRSRRGQSRARRPAHPAGPSPSMTTAKTSRTDNHPGLPFPRPGQGPVRRSGPRPTAAHNDSSGTALPATRPAGDRALGGSGAVAALDAVTFRDRPGRPRALPDGRQWADSIDRQHARRGQTVRPAGAFPAASPPPEEKTAGRMAVRCKGRVAGGRFAGGRAPGPPTASPGSGGWRGCWRAVRAPPGDRARTAGSAWLAASLIASF